MSKLSVAYISKVNNKEKFKVSIKRPASVIPVKYTAHLGCKNNTLYCIGLQCTIEDKLSNKVQIFAKVEIYNCAIFNVTLCSITASRKQSM